MSTTLDDLDHVSGSEERVETEYVDAEGRPNVALLQDRTPDWLRLSTRVVWLVFALGMTFTIFSYFPLWHTDLWGHLSYGRWMATHGQIPTSEPLLPLAEGMPFTNTAWLSQLAGYGMIRQFGVSGIQFLYALSITAAAALLTFTVYRRGRSLAAALLCLSAFLFASYQQLIVVRPQLAGLVCFTLVFVLATGSRWQRWKTWTIPLVFVIWVNLHGSFIVGLGLLAALLVGRCIDLVVRTRSWRMAFAEQGVRGLFCALELSALAVLINPYGIAVYSEVLFFSGNPNLKSLLEWEPLTLRMRQGQAALLLAVGLFAVYRLTPRRVNAREVLLLLGLGVAALWHSRMLVWWVPVAAYFLSLHAAAIWKRWRGAQVSEARRGGLWTVVAVGLIWICFAYTPFGTRVLHGEPQDPAVAAKRERRALSARTPVEIVEYLHENPPQGQLFNTYEWGDYLLWSGPPGLQVFLNSHAHLIPVEVWNDYLLIANGGSGWMERLDRYGVNAIVLDHAQRANVIRELEHSENWVKKYSDRLGAVFYRK